MYAGRRPDAEAKAIQRRFAAGPLPRLLPIAAVLDVIGRNTGNVVRVPLVIVPYKRRWYVVSMLGEDVNWVRNIRAADGRATLTHGRTRPVRLREVAPQDRPPILRRYLLVALGARPHMEATWRSPQAELDRAAASHRVFEVRRAA
jgi:hypothetical protein